MLCNALPPTSWPQPLLRYSPCMDRGAHWTAWSLLSSYFQRALLCPLCPSRGGLKGAGIVFPQQLLPKPHSVGIRVWRQLLLACLCTARGLWGENSCPCSISTPTNLTFIPFPHFWNLGLRHIQESTPPLSCTPSPALLAEPHFSLPLTQSPRRAQSFLCAHLGSFHPLSRSMGRKGKFLPSLV